MTGPHLPAFLRGQDSERVSRTLARPYPDTTRAAMPLYLAPMVSGDDFHLAHLLPLIYDAWMHHALTLDDAHFNQAVQAATGIYADLLSGNLVHPHNVRLMAPGPHDPGGGDSPVAPEAALAVSGPERSPHCRRSDTR